uniref:Uncharacterized protein n=1 Tax=Sphaerodactylus townsendi TaxID=933632 RepID=A0ACB8FZG6_9SAUR
MDQRLRDGGCPIIMSFKRFFIWCDVNMARWSHVPKCSKNQFLAFSIFSRVEGISSLGCGGGLTFSTAPSCSLGISGSLYKYYQHFSDCQDIRRCKELAGFITCFSHFWCSSA